jgi:hypothetical protein
VKRSRTGVDYSPELESLSDSKREALRRAVLLSDDDIQIASRLRVQPMLVKGMRYRLIQLGVLERPKPAVAPRRANTTDPAQASLPLDGSA